MSAVCLNIVLGPVVQSPISANPGLTLNKTYRVNPGISTNRALNNGALVVI